MAAVIILIKTNGAEIAVSVGSKANCARERAGCILGAAADEIDVARSKPGILGRDYAGLLEGIAGGETPSVGFEQERMRLIDGIEGETKAGKRDRATAEIGGIARAVVQHVATTGIDGQRAGRIVGVTAIVAIEESSAHAAGTVQ